MEITDHDLSDKRLIPMVIELYKFSDLQIKAAEAKDILDEMNNGEKMRLVTAYKRVIG